MTAALAHRGPDGDGYLRRPRAPRLSRPSPAGDHRHRRRRTSRCGTRTAGRRRLQRRNLQPRELRAELVARGHRFRTRHPTPRSWSTATRNGATTCRAGSTACSPSRSTTGAAAGCSWRATGSAKSRLYLRARRGFFAFASELSALASPSAVVATLDRARCRSSSPTATSRRRNALSRHPASCRAATGCARSTPINLTCGPTGISARNRTTALASTPEGDLLRNSRAA